MHPSARTDNQDATRSPPGGVPLSAADPRTRQGAPEHLAAGGLTPLTTVDFPGELAAVVFCQGCPWRCAYCHNGHLLSGTADRLISWPEVRGHLQRRIGLLDAVVFSGGEPTLQAALPAAIGEAATLGFKIGLHTAGCYPRRLRRLVHMLDWVGLDIKALPEGYPAITGVADSGERAWESLRILLGAGIRIEVRTTVLPGWTLEDPLGPLMERLAAAGVGDYALQGCRTETALDPTLRGMVSMPVSAAVMDLGGRLFSTFRVR
jgi:pyruvate formate lyase activating enzyme